MACFDRSFASPIRLLPVALALPLALGGCGSSSEGETGNVLPTATQTDTSGESESGSSEEGTTGEVGTGFPATYRFTCLDIQQAGSAGDGDIQTNLLQQTWGDDIDGYRLNILVDVEDLDTDAGTGTMRVRSGIGTDDTDLCSEPNSDSVALSTTFSAGTSEFIANPGADTCAQAATGSEAAFGSFSLTTDPQDVVYIYAADDGGEPLNCTSDTTPDAVPIRGVTASFTLSEDEQIAYGELSGCLVEAEAEGICSCLGTCVPPAEPFAQCGCNEDATPLRELLLGVTSTQNCTDLMGETAFDVKIAFTAERLPGVPDACG